MLHVNCLEHKPIKYMPLTQDKRISSVLQAVESRPNKIVNICDVICKNLSDVPKCKTEF